MQYPLTPLAITDCDFTTLHRVVKAVTGLNPLQSLDAAGISPGKPSAFLGALGLNGNARDTIRNKQYVRKHMMASFIGEVGEHTISGLANYTDLRILSEEGKRKGSVLLIMSGDLQEWFVSILSTHYKHIPSDIRFIMNGCLLYFERVGFNDLWFGYTKEQLTDDTFILRRSK